MAAIRALSTSICQPLVACNVYISAGRSHHSDLLLGILSSAQNKCRLLRTRNTAEKIAVVHAFADGPYDRSSFHLAGSPTPVVAVACTIIRQAIDGLLTITTQQPKDNEHQSRHPCVGLVDHVSVMPLNDDEGVSANTADTTNKDAGFYTTTGKAAREIGSSMTEYGITVHYYGNAHPNKTPLATVRREQTHFFQSSSTSLLTDSLVSDKNKNNKAGIATVGAPPTFVENFNIRLKSDKATAQSLTRLVRERNGGLPGVEALTLAYGAGESRFEVACNLLDPKVGSANAILAKVQEWQLQLDCPDVIVETAYRVGTTVDQCREALSLCGESQEAAIEYDKVVLQNFKEFLGGRPEH